MLGFMGKLGSGGWSGVGGVWVGVRGDGVGFGGTQVRGLGRSEELGSEEFGSRGRVGKVRPRSWRVRVWGWGQELGSGSGGLGELGSGGLELARKIGIRGLGELGSGKLGLEKLESGELGSKKLETPSTP